MAEFRWNDQAGRFVDARGRFVSEASVRAVIDQIADHASARLAASAQAMLDGTRSLATFQAEAMQTIKTAHLATATIAHGGSAQMSFSHYGSVGRQIRDEYAFMRGMAEDIASGRQPLNGSLTARARQYGQAARITYEREYGRDQQQRGYRFERNVIHSGESCNSCIAQSARGWVPVGTLIPVGSRTCRSNCRCSIRYSREAEIAA